MVHRVLICDFGTRIGEVIHRVWWPRTGHCSVPSGGPDPLGITFGRDHRRQIAALKTRQQPQSPRLRSVQTDHQHPPRLAVSTPPASARQPAGAAVWRGEQLSAPTSLPSCLAPWPWSAHRDPRGHRGRGSYRGFLIAGRVVYNYSSARNFIDGRCCRHVHLVRPAGQCPTSNRSISNSSHSVAESGGINSGSWGEGLLNFYCFYCRVA